MKGFIDGYPTRMVVQSESEGDKASYLVDLCAYPRGLNEQGTIVFNGSCQCRDFVCRQEPKLKDPLNAGKVFRCKHCRWVRDNILDFILPLMCDKDPNKNQ